MDILKSRASRPVMLHMRLVFIALMVIAIVLAIMPVPSELKALWPRWPALALLCWIITQPLNTVGIWTWALLGLLMDVLLYTPLGQQMMAYAAIGWISAYWVDSFNISQKVFLMIQTLILLLALEGVNVLIVLLTDQRLSIDLYLLGRILVGVLIVPLLCSIMPANDK